jgi:putative transposase
MPRHRYPSDLTDVQGMHLEPHLPGALPGGRPRAHPTRELVDAMRYVVRGGLAWRALPHDYPPWQTVDHSVRVWRRDGTWERLNHELREAVRERAGRKRHPSAGILDSQSAKTTEKGGRVVTTGPRS